MAAPMMPMAPQEPPTPSANQQMEPNPPEDRRESGMEMMQGLQKALYGDKFPPAQPEYQELVANLEANPAGMEELDAQWVSWARSLWNSRSAAVQKHLHLVARNRLYRAGYQWVQSRGGSPWANPARPKDTLRLVHNMIDKALDQRLQILTDQRPGFTVTPMTGDPDDRRKATARQRATEYQYEQMQMDVKAREAAYWAQTDGVAFWHIYWDDERGPWDEQMGRLMGAPKAPMGDLNCRTLRVEQVRVSPEATATVKPSWVVVRDVLTVSEAANIYGVTGQQAAESDTGHDQMTGMFVDSVANWVLTQTNVGEGERMRNEDTVERLTVYVDRKPGVLPNGLMLVIVGQKVVYGPDDLHWGTIPVIRISDGSSDPSWLPRPTMEQWIDHQMRMNVLLSKWQENIRVNAGGRFAGKPNSVATETFIGGVTSFLEVRAPGPVQDNITQMQGFSVGNDVKEAFALEKQAFEDASGYNSTSRGQVAGESGRAIIAAREQLERVFAPAVQAMATAFNDWAKVCLAGMIWGYDMPRQIGALGRGRPDLARALTSQDLDGSVDVKVEKGTLMPMPLSYRMYLLDSWLQYGVIDQKEYRRRQTFAVAKDVTTPDEDQEARAMRIADAIRLEQPVPPMRWQDNESIHQDVLEREILLQDDLPEQVVQAATQRWTMLSQQAAAKSGMLMGPPGAPPAPQGPPSGAPMSLGQLPPGSRPLSGSNPAAAVAPMVRMDMLGMPTDEQQAQVEDRLTPQ